MTGTDIQCGSLKRRTAKDCAERAAFAMKQFQSDRALCVDPQGRVTVENPKTACEYDLIGVFDTRRPVLELYKAVREELDAEVQKRGWREARRAA